MSERSATGAPRRPRGQGFGHGPPGMMRAPAGKSKDFGGAIRRLAGRLRPELGKLVLVLVLGIVSVTLVILGPRIIGHAMNVLFQGVIGERLPAGVTKQQVIAALQARGQGQLAAMLSGMNLTPGQGVDFARIGRILGVVALIYALSAAFGWMQQYLMAGISQRTMYRMREEVDLKLARLPLKYFDDHPRGDLLSRVTNDIDNISGTLQQSLSQIVTSVLTIVGVLIMMLTISPLLALISLVAVPVSLVVTMLIVSRSQKQFTAQWERTGDVDGYIEEVFTGHTIVKVFGKQRRAIESFDEQNQGLYEASFRAQFISGIIPPSMMFISNLSYVAIAVLGGIRVANGTLSLGDVTAFIQYSRAFTQPIMQTASIMNILQSTAASAERVFEL
ncbi:MAG TPA: ABC transporter ATP-binding protein, partial [Actinomycetota bacterium]